MKRTLLLWLMSTLFTNVLCCDCIAQRFERAYCASNSALRAKIVAVSDNCDGRVCDAQTDRSDGRLTYIARVTQLFRGSMPEDAVAYMESSIDADQCGANTLLLDEEYLFALKLKLSEPSRCPQSVFIISSCDFIQSWSSLSNDTKQFITDNVQTGQKLCGDALQQDLNATASPLS